MMVSVCKINTFVEMNQKVHRRTLLSKSTYTFLSENVYRHFQMTGFESVMSNVVAPQGQDITYHYVIISCVTLLKKQEIDLKNKRVKTRSPTIFFTFQQTRVGTCWCHDIFGNEYHYLLTCDFFKSDRKIYLKPYFYVKPNKRKYRKLLTSTNEATPIKLSKFAAIIMKKFSL